MITKIAEPSDISLIISEHLKNKIQSNEKPLFVFSSDIASDSWSEWAARNPDDSGVSAVALEDFTAWDKFKGTYLGANVSEKTCIPSLLRKIFIRSLIHQNLTEKFITKIIPSSKEDSENAYAFTDYLTKILPSIKLWHKKYTEYLKKEGLSPEADSDTENKDYYELYTRYNSFLESNNFFEPSWLEPEFVEKEKTIIIFYPEILEDFTEYEEVFSKSQNVILVTLPEQKPENKPLVYHFEDSRTELRRTLLRIRALNQSGVPWTHIALSLPNMEIYKPYIKREAKKYCIPVNIRAGEKLTQNCAGSIFRCIQDCYNSNFSYESVRTLLQNEYVPWKDEVRVRKENLLRLGNELRTLCSYEKDENSTEVTDVWLEALKNVDNTEQLEINFYTDLKREVTSLSKSKDFSSLKKAWFIFREAFLDSENFSGDANKILGRCLTELDNITEIEERYIKPLNLTVENPFSFFVNELNSKIYKPQEEINGVSVFPYKLSAQAYFEWQFVLDASQKNLDIPYKKLSFLNAEKRKTLLGKESENTSSASEAFIRLYAKKLPPSEVIFSYASETFTGFSIAHNSLKRIQNQLNPLQELDSTDFILNEQNSILNKDFSIPPNITLQQKESFETWAKKTENFSDEEDFKVSENIKSLIQEKIATSRGKNTPVATQSDLKNFYPCPRKWIFSKILSLKEDSLDTSLMQTFDMGNLNHKILELYMNSLNQNGKSLPLLQANNKFSEEKSIFEELETFTDKAIHNSNMDFKNSPIVLHTLEAQKDSITKNILNFLHSLCADFGGYNVYATEKSFSSKTENGTELYGKIDCILTNPTSGDFVIIDYKNTESSIPGAEKFADENNILGDFQMPMYITLLKDNCIKEDSTLKIEKAYFYAIKNGKRIPALTEKSSRTKKAEPEIFFNETIPAFKNYADNFAKNIKENNFSPVKHTEKKEQYINVDSFTDCKKCNFKGICRTTFSVGSKKIPHVNDKEAK